MNVQTLESIEVPVGKMVIVEIRIKDVDSTKRSMAGMVTASNKRHFTVQGQNYAETFLKVDLVLGLVGLTEPKIEVTEQRRSNAIELIPWTNKGADGSSEKNSLELILGTAK